MLLQYFKQVFPVRVLVIVLVGVIAFVSSLTILDAQFQGEDEAMALRRTLSLLQSLQRGEIKSFIVKLLRDYHPPARNIVTLPFIAILGVNEAALRLPNVLLWVAVCMVAVMIGWRLAGRWAGFFSGAFLAVSGLFDLEAMGLGHAGETLWVLLLIHLLVTSFEWDIHSSQARKRYLLGGLYCVIGFLWFTSLLPVCVCYHGMYGYAVFRKKKVRKHFKTYLFLTLPFVGFYLAYYAVFFGWPAYLVSVGEYSKPFGQLHQNLIRGNSSHFNSVSMSQNLRALNWYVLPFFSWILLFAGLIYQMRYYPKIFGVLIGYGALWSFYLYGNTAQHFFSYFCWLFPFGVAAFGKAATHWNRKIIALLPGIFLVSTGLWSYYTHIRTYTSETYPKQWISKVWGMALWQNNIHRPMESMAQELGTLLRPDEQFIVVSDGAFPLYYFRDERYIREVNISRMEVRREEESECLYLPVIIRQKYHIRAAVSFTHQIFCRENVEDILRYKESDLQITIFSEP